MGFLKVSERLRYPVWKLWDCLIKLIILDSWFSPCQSLMSYLAVKHIAGVFIISYRLNGDNYLSSALINSKRLTLSNLKPLEKNKATWRLQINEITVNCLVSKKGWPLVIAGPIQCCFTTRLCRTLHIFCSFGLEIVPKSWSSGENLDIGSNQSVRNLIAKITTKFELTVMSAKSPYYTGKLCLHNDDTEVMFKPAKLRSTQQSDFASRCNTQRSVQQHLSFDWNLQGIFDESHAHKIWIHRD